MRIIALILFAACGSRDADTASNVEPGSNEATQNAGETPASVAAEMPVDPGPAPIVDLQSVDDEGLSLRVRVPGPGTVELRRAVRIERQSDNNWELVDAEYKLRTNCQEASDACIALAAGAELSPPTISALTGQCGGSELAPGTYRFVVQSCAPEGTRPHEIHSVFTLNP